MLNLFGKPQDGLEQEIANVKFALANVEDIYVRQRLAEYLDRLIETRNKDRSIRIGGKELLGAAVSFTGLALILNHERLNVLSSSEKSWMNRFWK